jgi:hypothetical protein
MVKHPMIADHRRRRFAAVIVPLLIAAGLSLAGAHAGWLRPHVSVKAQGEPSPIPLQFPTATPTLGPPTETPTRTPTSEGRPYVEALSNDTNVRAGPDINANRIGVIYPGTTYPVIGRRFDWLEIEFSDSPSGTAWVYNGVVSLSGDESLIPELNLEDIPTLDPAFIAQQETLAYISATPGSITTLTAQAMITPTGVFTAGPGEGPTLVPGAPLPTYTFPPYTPTPVVIPTTNPPPPSSSGIPPILPILALGALGLMGLLIAILRRL